MEQKERVRMTTTSTQQQMSDMFWRRVEKRSADECWLWLGGLNRPGGYGRIGTHRDGQKLAHRKAYELTHGAIPDGMSVMHKCDTPRCCNPDHLQVGTHTDNMRDMALKGRNKYAPTNRKLRRFTDDAVRDIRSSSETQDQLARRYGVPRSTIASVCQRRCYKEVI